MIKLTDQKFIHPIILFTFLGIICSMLACKYDSECKDVDYGQQAVVESATHRYPFISGQTLVFKDSADHELFFRMVPIPIGKIIKSYVNFSFPQEEGYCAGISNITGTREFYLLNFRSDSLDYLMISQYGAAVRLIENDLIFYDFIDYSISRSKDPVMWHLRGSHHTNDRGNENYFVNDPISYVFSETLLIGTREFENVYSHFEPDGSELHFNHTYGYIAFRQSGLPLWTLDRIE